MYYLKYFQSPSALKIGGLLDLKQHRSADIQNILTAQSVCCIFHLART